MHGHKTVKLDLARLHEAAHPDPHVTHPNVNHFSCNEQPDETTLPYS